LARRRPFGGPAEEAAEEHGRATLAQLVVGLILGVLDERDGIASALAMRGCS
jgi:hypothetical protein